MKAQATASVILGAMVMLASASLGAPRPSIARGFAAGSLPTPPTLSTSLVPIPGQTGLITLPTPPDINISNVPITQVPGFNQAGGSGSTATAGVAPFFPGSAVRPAGVLGSGGSPSTMVVYSGGYTVMAQAYGYPSYYPMIPSGMIRNPGGYPYPRTPPAQPSASSPPASPQVEESTPAPGAQPSSPAPLAPRAAGPIPSDPTDLPLDEGLQATIESEANAAGGTRAAIVVYDFMGRRRAVYQPDPTLYPGSVIKLAVMLSVFRQVKAGLLPAVPKVGEGLRRMIDFGDHAAANTLIDVLGISRINAIALDEGLADTYLSRRFNDPAPADGTRLNAMSPVDSARLLYRIARRELVDPAASERMLDLLGRQTRNDGISRGIGDAPGVRVYHLPATASLTDQGEVSNDVAIVTGPAHGYVLSIYTTAASDQTEWIAQVAGKIHKLLTAARP